MPWAFCTSQARKIFFVSTLLRPPPQEKEPFSLRLAMEDALKELAPKAAKNQLTVTLHMDPDLPAIVIGVPPDNPRPAALAASFS